MSKRIGEKYIEDRMNVCVYFTGIHREVCKAGVNYHEMLGDNPVCFAHMPCFRDDLSPVSCQLAKYPTREEAEQEEREVKEITSKFLKVLSAAHAHAKENGLGQGHGGSGNMPCPSGCGGTLHYSVASVNGHMHASCSKLGCTSWME